MTFAALAAAAAVCAPLPGVEQLWARPEVRFVVFGELHGTAETPALFADAVCHAGAARPVNVALEFTDTEQAALDLYMASDGGAAAKAAFLRSVIWSTPMPDGRSSEAMLALVERLRVLKAAGRVRRVIATQPLTAARGSADYERAMAEAWTSAAKDGRLLVLVGNLHARKMKLEFDGRTLEPAASHLPGAQTLTVDVPVYGEAWNCQEECGPHRGGIRTQATRGVVLGGDDGGAYDAIANIGAITTASPPAVAAR